MAEVGVRREAWGVRPESALRSMSSSSFKPQASSLVLVMVLSFTAPAYAEKSFAVPQATQGIATSPAGGMASVMLSLLLVLAAVFAAAWLMRRLRAGNAVTRGVMEVLADLPLGTKERAVLVRVGKEQVLLGVAPGRVNTLHVFAEGQGPVIAADTSTTSGAPTAPDFKGVLRRSLGL